MTALESAKDQANSGRNGDVPNLTADPSLAQRELGFLAKRDLKMMCDDLWRFQTAHPRGYEV